MTAPRCPSCIAVGLFASALLHGAVGGFWLGRAQTPVEPPASLELELDLALFAAPPAAASVIAATASAHEAPTPPPVAPEPTQPAEPEPEAAPPPEPPPPLAPQRLPSPTAIARLEPSPEAPPRPVAKPRKQPKPKPEVETQTKPRLAKPARTPPPEPVRKPKSPEQQRPVDLAGSSPAQAPTETAIPGPAVANRGAGQSKAQPSADRNQAERTYLAALQRAIGRHQRFPDDARRRRKTGVATLSFVVQADGRLVQVRIAKSSGDGSLDKAAVEALNRLARFKPIPEVLDRPSWSMRVPIRFDLR